MRWLVAFLLVVPGASAHPMLVAVVPDLPGTGPGDEGFAVGSNDGGDLSGWSVTDGKGLFAFPAGSVVGSGEMVWVVANRTAWSAFDGPPAQFVWTDSRLQLANGGDALRLVDLRGTVVDSVAWGPGSGLNVSSPGLVFERDRLAGQWIDTGSDGDWVTPRVHRIGESTIDPPTFTVHTLTLYASPDSSFSVLTHLVQSAERRLHLHVYELRSAALVDALVAAKQAHPALDLQVLVEAAPVGMTAPERHATADALRRIQGAGGTVVLAGRGRYDDHHLKVLVADDAVSVQSENWVESGVPEDPTWGNRGWGVVLHDTAAADWFATWMAQDRSSWDVDAFDLHSYDALFVAPPRVAPRSGGYGPVMPPVELRGDFGVQPLVSPDHTADPRTDPVAALMRGARQEIDLEELELATGSANRLGWHADDALVSALSEAAQRGVHVRVLAAAPFASDPGNEPALAALRVPGAEARIFDRRGIAILHNKGLIVDDAVVVGSMNGNHHSRAANREVDVILRGPGVADAYRVLFETDWQGKVPGPDASVIGRDVGAIPSASWPMLLAATALAARQWSSRRGPGPPSP
ncbi:MAG: phospholipase D-like domain-containing protein [bacterium]